MKTVLMILVGLAMLATVGVLLAGVLGMGGDSARSQRLMRWRILLQFAALVLFALLLLLARS